MPARLRKFLTLANVVALFFAGNSTSVAADRINHAGRILGPLPIVTNALLFNTAAADAVVSAMQILPKDNPWNEDISRRPAHPNSSNMISQISSDLLSSRRTLRAFEEMNFVLVPDHQPAVPITFFNYGNESDPSPYPFASSTSVEGWPSQTGALTLEQWQRDINNTGGDRHSIVVMPGTGFIWETWLTKLTNTSTWRASNGAKFDLNSNALRPAGWTSGDAAGLPMFPALVRFDECERGEVEHALRIVVKRTRAEYIYPARHYASVPFTTDTNVPAMGERLRLKSSFVIPNHWTKQETAVLNALKKYGALVADNGNFFSISITPDNRWPSGAFANLSSINVTNFEAVITTGANEGPRSPGAPSADAGPDVIGTANTSLALNGVVSDPDHNPAVLWKIYSGPGSVSFDNATNAATSAQFSVPGDYILMLSSDDGIHTPAYDTAHITISDAPIELAVSRNGAQLNFTWLGGAPPYVLQSLTTFAQTNWINRLTTMLHSASLPISGSELTEFFRVRGGVTSP